MLHSAGFNRCVPGMRLLRHWQVAGHAAIDCLQCKLQKTSSCPRFVCRSLLLMASRVVPVPLPSPSNSPPPMDRRTEFALVNSLWLDVISSSFAASSTLLPLWTRSRKLGKFSEKAVMVSGAEDNEKAALCSMWQHYDLCFNEILHSLLHRVKLNEKLIAQKQTGQLQGASTVELPSLKTPLSPSLPSPNFSLAKSSSALLLYRLPKIKPHTRLSCGFAV